MVALLEHDRPRVPLPSIAQLHMVDAFGLGTDVDGDPFGCVPQRYALHHLTSLAHDGEHQVIGKLQGGGLPRSPGHARSYSTTTRWWYTPSRSVHLIT